MNNRGLFFIALAVFAGCVCGAFILGKSVERFKTGDRYISVKGFSEREVKADMVIWNLKVRMAVDDLQAGSKAMESARNKVIEFLTKNGIKTEEITQKHLAVTDKLARDYDSPNSMSKRYIIEEHVEVRSNQVDLVEKVSRMTSELLNAGMVLASGDQWGGGDLKFIFTGLNLIKPAMLAEATVNAQKAAEQFTETSHTKLGKMRKASQGLFTIMERDESLTQQSDGGYYGAARSDLYKKIRVVISVEYAID